MADQRSTEFSGKRIIVVQDDYPLGMRIINHLKSLGATALGPAPTPFYANLLIGRRKIDAALLDVHLHGETVFELAAKLKVLGVPVIFVTDYDREALPSRFHDDPFLELPPDWDRLDEELKNLFHRPVPATQTIIRPVLRAGVLEGPIHAFARTIARSLMAQSDLR